MIYIFLLKFLKKVLTSKNKDVILIFVVAKAITTKNLEN